MVEKVKQIFHFTLYPYLIGLFYFAYKLSFGPVEFDWQVALSYFMIFSTISFGIIFLVKRLFSFKQVTVLLFFCWVMFFFHGDIIRILETIFTQSKVRYKYVWLTAFFIGLIFSYFSFKFRKYNASLNMISNVFISFLIIINILQTVMQYSRANARILTAIKNNRTFTKEISPKTDIIWILMDEYASSVVLKSRFSFNNSLDSFLIKKGFFILPEIKSRSNLTMYSVNSIFNFDDSIEPYGLKYAAYELENSAFPIILKEKGYKFKALTFFNIGNEKQIEKMYTYHQSLIFQLIQGTILDIIMQNYSKKYYKKPFYYQKKLLIDYNGYVYKNFLKEVNIEAAKPIFFWVHFLIPHGPLFKHENGLLKPLTFNPADTSSLKNGYIEYLKYGNYLLEKMINENPKLLNKIVIISGDHGVNLGYIKEGDDRIKPYFAIYIPRIYDTSELKKLKFISQLPYFLLNN